MLVISREDGSVTGQFTQADKEAMWRAIVRNLGPKVLAEQKEKSDG